MTQQLHGATQIDESPAHTDKSAGSVVQYSAMDVFQWLTEAHDYATGLYDATGVRTEIKLVSNRPGSLMFKVIASKDHGGHWVETFLYASPMGIIQSKGEALRNVIARAVNNVHAHVKRMDAISEHVDRESAPKSRT